MAESEGGGGGGGNLKIVARRQKKAFFFIKHPPVAENYPRQMPLKVDPSPHNFNSLPLLLLLLCLFFLLPQNPCIVNSNAFIISIVKINVCADRLCFYGLGPFGPWGPGPGSQLRPWPLGPIFHGVGLK